MSSSHKQVVALIAFVFGVAVFLGTLATLTDFNALPDTKSGEIGLAKFDCMGRSDYDECADRVDRQFRVGAYEPWYERQPLLAAALAGVAVFFGLAGAARLALD